MSEEENRKLQNTDEKSAEKSAAGTSSGATGGWLSWYNGAKAKTLSTFDLVKRDLAEFSETVGQQAAATLGAVVPENLNQAPQVLGSKASQWMKNFAQTVNEAVLKMGDTVDDDDQQTIVASDLEKRSSFASGKLIEIQSDPETFLHEPAGAPELFEDWLDHFDIEAKKQEIKLALDESASLRDNLVKLVPSQIAWNLFWARYFYKIHQLELEKAALMRKFSKSASPPAQKDDKTQNFKRTVSGSSIGESWGDDSDLDELSNMITEKMAPSFEDQVKLASLDDKMATAVLEKEDLEQKVEGVSSSSDIQKIVQTPSDVLSLSDATDVVSTNDIVKLDEDVKQSCSTASNSNNGKNLDEELCSEKSFSIVNSSGTSSLNGDGQRC